MRPAFRRFAIVAFAILLPVAAHAAWDHVELRRLIREIAAIRDRGEAVAVRDIDPVSPVTPEQKQASRLYLAAAALSLDRERDKSLETDMFATGVGRKRSAEERVLLAKRLETALAGYGPTFALLEEASSLDFSALAPGTEHSYRTSSFWSLGRLNTLRAAHLCLTGQADEAGEAILATVRLGRVLTLGSGSWGMLLSPGAFDLGFVLSHCAPSATVLQRLQQSIEALEEKDGLVHSLLSERVSYIAHIWRRYGRDARGPENVDFRFWTPSETVMRPWLTHRLVSELRMRAELIDAARQPWGQRQKAIAFVASRYPSSGRAAQPPIVPYSGSALIESDMPRANHRLALLRASTVALGVERYRRDHGRSLPDALTDLVPKYLDAVPEDPFSGSPTLYRASKSGYTIYSVGADGEDDGGDLLPLAPQCASRAPASNTPDIGLFIATVQ